MTVAAAIALVIEAEWRKAPKAWFRRTREHGPQRNARYCMVALENESFIEQAGDGAPS